MGWMTGCGHGRANLGRGQGLFGRGETREPRNLQRAHLTGLPKAVPPVLFTTAVRRCTRAQTARGREVLACLGRAGWWNGQIRACASPKKPSAWAAAGSVRVFWLAFLVLRTFSAARAVLRHILGLRGLRPHPVR